MFSGIVTAIGTIQRLLRHADSIDFAISIPNTWNDITLGESIAINGVCLTVTDFTPAQIHVTAVQETLRVTNLGNLTENSLVNLERAITPTTRLGGHYVQGHVDAVGEILTIQSEGPALLTKIGVPATLMRYIVRKGYVTLDGMSITIIDTGPDWFTVTFIPHTQEITIVNHYDTGRKINIEVDMMGKYIEKLVIAQIPSELNRT